MSVYCIGNNHPSGKAYVAIHKGVKRYADTWEEAAELWHELCDELAGRQEEQNHE